MYVPDECVYTRFVISALDTCRAHIRIVIYEQPVCITEYMRTYARTCAHSRREKRMGSCRERSSMRGGGWIKRERDCMIGRERLYERVGVRSIVKAPRRRPPRDPSRPNRPFIKSLPLILNVSFNVFPEKCCVAPYERICGFLSENAWLDRLNSTVSFSLHFSV